MLQQPPEPTKGYIVLFDPVKRTKGERINFMFNPNQLTVTFTPNYTFKSAPVNSNSFAQFGNSEPMTVKFDLFLRGKTVPENLALLKRLVDNKPLRSPFAYPPLCRLYLGRSLDWIGQSVISDSSFATAPDIEFSKTVPTGVIDSMEIVITRQSPTLKPYEATVTISFSESNLSALNETFRV